MEEQEAPHLKVLEAYTRDVGRGVARIDYDTMDALKASTGDVIEITGKKITVAKCLPLYPSDEGKEMIRIDGLGRTNCDTKIGEKISIRKIKALGATKINVIPLEAIPPVDERYLAEALESVPVINGDKVMIPYFGGRLSFQIKETTPENAVVVTRSTIFEIKERIDKPSKMTEKLQKEYDEIIAEIKKIGASDEPIDVKLLKKKTAQLRDIQDITKEISNLKID